MSQGYCLTLRRVIHADKAMPGCKIVAMQEAKVQVSTCQRAPLHSGGIADLCEEEEGHLSSSSCTTAQCTLFYLYI